MKVRQTFVWLSWLAVCASLAATAAAQVVPPAEAVIRLDTQVVSLTVTVTDKRGRHLPALEQNAFTIFEDQVAQEISFFNQADTPVSIAVVFDLSASMRGAKIEQARVALERFLLNCHPADEYSLIGFNERAWVALDRIRDGQQLLRQFSAVQATGRTALYDAVALGLTQLEHGLYPRRALLLISDGEDNRSRTSFRQISRMARESAALVYAIGITDFTLKNNIGGMVLEGLAEQSGGTAFFPPNGEAMCEAFEAIALELRRQYSLGYTPSNFVADGKWRKLKVKVSPPADSPKIVVRSRPGYYSKPAANAAQAEN